MNKEGEAAEDIVNEGGTLRTAAKKYVNKKDSAKGRKRKAARKAHETKAASSSHLPMYVCVYVRV